MTSAIGLQLIAGLCFAALTIWRPFMRSDSTSHKVWHTVIGVIGMAALAAGAFLNSASQTRYTEAFNNLTASVRKLAGPASTKADANVDQILSAAATKLIEQQKQINELAAQEREDHSAQKALRDFFARVNPLINAAVDAGRLDIPLVLQPAYYDELRQIISRPDAVGVAAIVSAVPFTQTNSINCGAPGGVCPGNFIKVIVKVDPSVAHK